MSYLNNKDKIFPLIAKNFNGKISNEDDVKFNELKKVVLDFKVIGANKGCYYKLNWIGNGWNGRYDILIDEYIKDNFDTEAEKGKKTITNLLSNSFTSHIGNGIQTVTFKSVDQTITIIATIDYSSITGQMLDIGGESFIIDESCYIYDNSSFIEVDFSNEKSPILNVYSNKYKFEFKKYYCNQIFAWWKTYKKNSSFNTPSLFNVSGDVTDFGVETDLIGPIISKAVNNGSQHDRVFCGGQHGADNSTTGNPTAETRYVEIWIDGTNIISSGTYACKEVDIYVSNYIMSYNTIPVNRYTINELVHYKIRDGKVEVEVTLRPLEHVKVETYYGMQMAFTDYTHIQFNGGWGSSDRRQTISNTEGSLKKNYFYNSAILNSNNHNDILELKIFNEGLGNREFVDNNQSLIFTTNGKVYHRLCGFYGNTKSFDMFPNKLYYWKGYYHFKSRI